MPEPQNIFLKQQNFFLSQVMKGMTGVLEECNRKKEDCACSVQVSYLNDSSLPESARYKTSIFCAKRGDGDFYDKISRTLRAINNPIDPLK